MKTKIVQFDSETLPPLTDEQVQRLQVLASRPESEIEYSDIPPLDVNTATKVHRGRFYSPPQRQIIAQVDADIAEWLQTQGAGFQSRLNAILRREMSMDSSHPNLGE